MSHNRINKKQRNEAMVASRTGFRQQGMAKRISSLSIGQLRTMFPEISHFSENELRREAIRRLMSR